MESKMTAKTEGINTTGRFIQFKDYKFTTEDPKEIEFIESLPNFGSEYKELKDPKDVPADRAPKPTVAKAFEEKGTPENRLHVLEATMGNLTAAIGAIAEKLDDLAKTEKTPAQKAAETKAKNKAEAEEAEKKATEEALAEEEANKGK